MSGLDVFRELWGSQKSVVVSDARRPDAARQAEDALGGTSPIPQRLLLFATSGTEGAMKWVGLTREALLCNAHAVNEHLMIHRDDHFALALPVHHVGGFALVLRAFEAGCQVVEFGGKWNASEFVKFLVKNRTSVTSLVPTQVYDLVQMGLRAPDDLRIAVVGGGRLAPEIVREAHKLGWPVLPSYGLTEAASQVATFAPQRLDEPKEDFTLLDVLPIWDTRVEEGGLLRISGPSLAKGYLQVSRCGDVSWFEIDQSAGLLTRDKVELIELCGKPFLRFLGRQSSFVKILGELVNIEEWELKAQEISRCLGSHASVALVAVPDPRAESRLVLVCEGDQETADKIRAEFCARSPGYVHPLRTIAVDALPRTALGKLDRAKLASLA